MIIFPLLLTTTLLVTPTTTPSIEPSPTNTSEIQRFREIIQEKVKAKLQEINQVASIDPKRGYLGTITKIDSNQILLDVKETNRTINIDTNTVFLNTKSTKIKYVDLKVGQEILVIGLIDEQNNLYAKRILITNPKETINLKTIIFGQVVDISSSSSVIAIIPISNKNTQYQLKTDHKNIQILSKDGSKLSLKDITKGKKIIIVSTSSPISNQTLTAEKIIVM